MINQITCGDCFDVFPSIPDGSIDLIFSDLPYGTTQSKRDGDADLPRLWKHYLRMAKENAAIVLFSHNQFTIELAMSQFNLYRYRYIWVKNKTTNYLNAKRMPMRGYEELVVFYRKQPTYNPQFSYGHKPMNWAKRTKNTLCGKHEMIENDAGTTRRYPKDVLYYDVVNNDDPDRICEFQKPVDLCEFIIRTYTDAGDLVLDGATGSGVICKAAQNTGRNYIGIEIDPVMAEKAQFYVK